MRRKVLIAVGAIWVVGTVISTVIATVNAVKEYKEVEHALHQRPHKENNNAEVITEYTIE